VSHHGASLPAAGLAKCEQGHARATRPHSGSFESGRGVDVHAWSHSMRKAGAHALSRPEQAFWENA
jgi:hypothetical protein